MKVADEASAVADAGIQKGEFRLIPDCIAA